MLKNKKQQQKTNKQKHNCLEAPPYIFQPGTFTGGGSEGVNITLQT